MRLVPLYRRFLPTPQPGPPPSASPVCPLPGGLPTHPFSMGYNRVSHLLMRKPTCPFSVKVTRLMLPSIKTADQLAFSALPAPSLQPMVERPQRANPQGHAGGQAVCKGLCSPNTESIPKQSAKVSCPVSVLWL